MFTVEEEASFEVMEKEFLSFMQEVFPGRMRRDMVLRGADIKNLDVEGKYIKKIHWTPYDGLTMTYTRNSKMHDGSAGYSLSASRRVEVENGEIVDLIYTANKRAHIDSGEIEQFAKIQFQHGHIEVIVNVLHPFSAIDGDKDSNAAAVVRKSIPEVMGIGDNLSPHPILAHTIIAGVFNGTLGHSPTSVSA